MTKVHEPYNGPKQRKEHLLYLEHNEPMVFGENKALKLSGLTPTVTDDNDNSVLTHDASTGDTSLAYMLANLSYPDFPVPVGIFHQSSRTTYDQLLHSEQQKTLTSSKLMTLLEKDSYVL